MIKLCLSLTLGCALLALTGCADPPKVLQGKVVSYDAAAALMVVEDELPGNARVELGTAGAEFGAEPAAGDLVRVAYRERDGKAQAHRVMNLTRQAELGGSPSH